MPTIEIRLRDGSVRLGVKKDGTLVTEQDWHYRIRADSLTQSREEILLSTPDVPKFGEVYAPYGMMLKGADGSFLDEDPLLWDCVYNLSNQVEEGESTNPATGQPQFGDPTAWIPVVELGFEDYQEVFNKGLPIAPNELHTDSGGSDPTGYTSELWVNSAGDPFDQGFVRQRRIITRNFVQFEAMTGPNAVTLDQIEDRDETLNAVEYLGRPKRTLKLSVNRVAAGFYYGMRCWRVDYVIAYKKTGWRIDQVDNGWQYIWDGEKYEFRTGGKEDGSNVLGGLNGVGGPSGGLARPPAPESGISDLDPANAKILYFKGFEFC